MPADMSIQFTALIPIARCLSYLPDWYFLIYPVWHFLLRFTKICYYFEDDHAQTFCANFNPHLGVANFKSHFNLSSNHAWCNPFYPHFHLKYLFQNGPDYLIPLVFLPWNCYSIASKTPFFSNCQWVIWMVKFVSQMVWGRNFMWKLFNPRCNCCLAGLCLLNPLIAMSRIKSLEFS